MFAGSTKYGWSAVLLRTAQRLRTVAVKLGGVSVEPQIPRDRQGHHSG
jgi:hypothetical protein